MTSLEVDTLLCIEATWIIISPKAKLGRQWAILVKFVFAFSISYLWTMEGIYKMELCQGKQ